MFNTEENLLNQKTKNAPSVTSFKSSLIEGDSIPVRTQPVHDSSKSTVGAPDNTHCTNNTSNMQHAEYQLYGAESRTIPEILSMVLEDR